MKTFIAIALAGLIGGAVGFVGGWCMGNDEQAALLAAGAPGAIALERYRSTHGRYPDSLSEAGVALPEGTTLPFTYRAVRGGQDYELVAGDYFRDGMVIGYTASGVFVDR